jgi:hypothetical protein
LEFRHQRNTKELLNSDRTHGTMNSGKYSYDYTPLFKFLLAKVGQLWDDVYSEAKSRLDREAPIFWLAALYPKNRKDIVRCGESSYYSGLFVDDDGFLQVVNPSAELTVRVAPFETLSFNGEVIHI